MDISRPIKIIIALFFALIMGIAVIACSEPGDKPDDPPAATLPPQERAEQQPYEGVAGETITLAAKYANTVQGYYYNSSRSRYILENTNSRLVYRLIPDNGFSGVESIENTKGGVYVADTMDTYIKMSDGSVFYAGASQSRANLYDQGFYYYNLHILDHTFGLFDSSAYSNSVSLESDNCYAVRDMEKPVYRDDGTYSLTVKSTYDPYFCMRVPANKYKFEDYDAFSVTMKVQGASDVQLYYIGGDNDEFTADAVLNFKAIPDNEFHTYTISFDTNKNLSKYLKAYRIDAGAFVGEEIVVKDFSLVKLKDSLPPFKLDRTYNMYPDKINENVRFVAVKACDAVQSVGTVTEIPEEKVAKFVINDNSGPHYNLSEVDWNTAAYAGFDIKDAGVFGIILGADENYCGKLTVTLENGVYKIVQELDCAERKVKKGGSIYMARRVYVDESHDFSAFLQEAYYERNPLELTVDAKGSSKKNSFAGYDDLTGAYILKIAGTYGFDESYENPLKEHKVKFTPSTDGNERTIYVRGETANDGCLECAVVLGEDGVLMPIKVEVCKNFAKDGEELFYTEEDSHAYGLSIFPVAVGARSADTFTLADLYEQWGSYRLKQISSIRWHTAYYHLSLGVTETNCINIYSTASRLPDHRGLSTYYWSDEKIDIVDVDGNPTGKTKIFGQQPQHSNNGSHLFLQYTDANGNFNSYENIGRTVISSAGPTLADLTLYYLSFDGKVLQTCRQVEMPSTDENRAFFELEYEFLADVTVNDPSLDMILYGFSTPYEKFGYLDKDGNSVIESTSPIDVRVIPLGDNCPYFDYFHIKTNNPKAYTEEACSSNLSFLLKSAEVTIGGKAYTGGYAVREGNGMAAFVLNLTKKTTFKKGDTIKISCILMPWGGYHSEDDANVRIVRENTLLNPIKLECASGSVVDDKLVPTVKSDDGKSCEFTVSGGYANVRDLPGYATAEYTKYKSTWERDYNVTVVIKGIKDVGVPKIYEKNGEDFSEYVVASSLGYDGYTVAIEDDGTFTYSFVVTMTEAKARTFRVEITG